MKALTITQPWATLIMLGAKRFETRPWATDYRGLLAIHSSKAFPMEFRDLVEAEPFRRCLREWGLCQYPKLFEQGLSDVDLARELRRRLPCGLVLGEVFLADVRPCVDVRGAIQSHPGEDLGLRAVPHNELAFGDFTAGRWAFDLEVVSVYATPIPARGNLGIWDWMPSPAEAATVGGKR